MVTGRLKSDSTITLTIEVPLSDDRAKKGATWTSGGKQYKTEFHETTKKIVPEAQPSQSVDAYVSGPAEASKSAWCAYITFAGNAYDSADASYATWGE